jgi:enoyl-[acyl-carrier protein] reductase II
MVSGSSSRPEEVKMLHTPLCELLGIEHPIIQAGMGPFGSGAELAAAVSNAGALGSLGGAARPLDDLRHQLDLLRASTSRPYAVNFTQPWLQQNPDAFEIALAARPAVISLALGDPGELVQRAHDGGVRFIQQVHTVEQARLVAERGVDVIIAQGTEAGGFTGGVATLILVPQVVDAVSPIPIVAAGGIADGRGLAAALVLGASGANLGTRFLASAEATIAQEWKQAILDAQSEDAVKTALWDDLFPKPGGGAFDVVPRALRTAFIERWQARPDEARRAAQRLQNELMSGVREGRMREYVPFTGQSAGLIRDLPSAAQIVARLVSEAEVALHMVGTLVS